jgi:hypothetical protein
VRPVRSELEFHGNSGHDSEDEIDPENARPESRRLIVALVFVAQGQRFENHDKRR